MRVHAAFVVGVSLATFGCGLVGLVDPNYAYATQGDLHPTIHLVRDTPEVRALLANAAPQKVAPSTAQLRDAMAREPGVVVPGGSYVRLLEFSRAQCEDFNHFNFMKVRVTSGRRKGAEGWACFMTDISPTFP
jgi:hypothetical protein